MVSATLAVALSTLMFAGLARAVMGVTNARRPWQVLAGGVLLAVLTVFVMMALIVLVSLWDHPVTGVPVP